MSVAVATPQEDEVRKASCFHCGKQVDSNDKLPFFNKKENQSTDSFYCGCFGWD